MPKTSLKKIEEVISSLEQEYAVPVAMADQQHQQATLKFLAALREMVQAFCLQGKQKDEEFVYLQYSLRDK